MLNFLRRNDKSDIFLKKETGFNYNTLSFSEPLEGKYFDFKYDAFVSDTRKGLVLSIIYLTLLSFIDYQLRLESFMILLKFKLVVILPLFMLFWSITYTKFFKKYSILILSLLESMAGMVMIAMLYLTSGTGENYIIIHDMYLFAFILQFIWSFLYIRLKHTYSISIGALIIISYFIVSKFILKHDGVFIQSNFIVLSISFLMLAIAGYGLELRKRKDFFLKTLLTDQKHKLDDMNSNLEQIVLARTKELTKLNIELEDEIQVRKGIEENRNRLVEDLRHLNDTAVSFIDSSDDDSLYQMIATNIRYFIGECLVVVCSMDCKHNYLNIEAINGPQDYMDHVNNIFEDKIIGYKMILKKEYVKVLREGIVERITVPRAALPFVSLNSQKQDEVFDIINMGKVFVIGFSWKKQIYGCAVIYSYEKNQKIPIELIETHARQATIAIQSKQVRDKQIESERKLHFLIENAADGVFVADTNGRFTEVNLYACESLGYSNEELIKLSFSQIEVPHGEKNYKTILNELSNNQKITHCTRHRRKDGTSFPVEVRLALLSTGDSRLIIAFARDISDRVKTEDEIRKFKTISDNANFGMVIVSAEGEISYSNSYFAQIHGYKINEIIGENLSMFYSETQKPILAKKNAEIYKKGSFSSTEVWHKHYNGIEIPILLSGVGLFDKNKKLQNIAITALDITDLKNTELELQYRLQIENLLNVISNIFLETSTDFLENKINRSLELLGSLSNVDRSYIYMFENNEETMSKTHEWDAEGIEGQMDKYQNIKTNSLRWLYQMMKARLIVNFEKLEDIPIEASAEQRFLETQGVKSLLAVPMFLQDDLIGFLGLDSVKNLKKWSGQDISIMTTITEIIVNGINRKMISDSIKESEEKYRRLFEDSKDMVFESTPDGKMVDINRAGVEMLGYDTKEELLGIDVADHYIDPRLREQYVSLMEKQGYVKDYESILLRKNGDILYIIESATAVMNDDGEIMSYRGVIKDITSRVENENQLKSVNKELELSYRRLKLIQQVMIRQEKMASIGQLSAGVAHEINNPLGFVSSNFATLRKYIQNITEYMEEMKKIVFDRLNNAGIEHDDIDKELKKLKRKKKIDYILEDVEELLSESDEGFERIKSIVQNMKSFARMDMGDEFDDINLNEAVEKTLIVARNEVKYVADVIKEFSELPLIKGHRSEINQVILNLVVNAADAIEEEQRKDKGTIFIKTYLEDDFVCLMIKDDGPGVKEELIHKIFDPFFTSKEQGKGTGLGLYISYDIIVNKHGGIVEVHNNEDKGSRFIVKLPRTPDKYISESLKVDKE